MRYRLAADAVLVLHLAFIVFVTLGGLLNLRWKRFWLLHLPALIWGFVVEFLAVVCPLTTIENYFRVAAGEHGYERGFIDYFISSLIYPGLSPSIHILLGIVLALLNLVIYFYLFKTRSISFHR